MTFTISSERQKQLKTLAKYMYDVPNVTPRLITKILAMISSLAYAVLPWILHSRALAHYSRPIIKPPVDFLTTLDVSNLGYGGTGPKGKVILHPFPFPVQHHHST
eukprot:TRINITY_DN5556_c0_g2_i1.p1 TRINITY_DN5556_c0_g2~~TRINITY_DN5556_c0_g2_i1.p1  ORF type:complete len:105 (-),score=1.71 TRINITY_DN5556_c0_g2_i1:275-589(-)